MNLPIPLKSSFCEIEKKENEGDAGSLPPRPVPLPPFLLPQLLKPKPPEVRKDFVELDVNTETLQRLTAVQVMREIDRLRMYVPTDSERHQFNLPERLFVHSIQECLTLCGGRKGARFSTEELRTLQQLGVKLEESFQELDAKFKLLSKAARVCIVETSHNNQSQDALELEESLQFQDVAKRFLTLRKELLPIVRLKREEVAASTISITKDKDSDIPSSALNMPLWLQALCTCYFSAINKIPTKSTAVPNSLGRFSGFLAHLVTSGQMLRCSEDEALCVLIHASNDQLVQTLFSRTFCNAYPESTVHKDVKTMQLPEKYWSKRFYSFLKSLKELGTVPQDEIFLQQNWNEV